MLLLVLYTFSRISTFIFIDRLVKIFIDRLVKNQIDQTNILARCMGDLPSVEMTANNSIVLQLLLNERLLLHFKFAEYLLSSKDFHNKRGNKYVVDRC